MSSSAGICEDDEVLRDRIRRALEQADFVVKATATGAAALAAFSHDPPDVLVLDIGLPDADGRDVCQALRARGVATPILFVSALDQATALPSAMDAGGDDFLAKPFALAELLVRVGGLLQRGRPRDTARLDPARRALVAGQLSVDLTPTEFRLLTALTAARGDIVSRAQLVAAAWPPEAVVSDNTLDAYVARLRRKLRYTGSEQAIRTRRGVGYQLR